MTSAKLSKNGTAAFKLRKQVLIVIISGSVLITVWAGAPIKVFVGNGYQIPVVIAEYDAKNGIFEEY
ncbi:hypothetical protein EFR93_04805 [Lentilactobacillus buchneri]|nr:hypothetical protein [Lentilactobacillus buchneri]